MFRIRPHMWHRIQGCPHLGAGICCSPVEAAAEYFCFSQVLKGRFEGSGGGRQIPLQACRIPTIVLKEDKVECRVGVWASPPLEDGPRRSGVRHVLSLRESDSNIWQLINHLAGADLPLPNTIKLDFRPIQNTHFTAVKSKGKT